MSNTRVVANIPRFGRQSSGGTRIYGNAGFTTDMAAPTDDREAVKVERFGKVQWLASMPDGITGFDVTLYRLVKVEVYAGEPKVLTTLFSEWVVDSTASYTASALVYQDVHGQDLYARVHNIAGSITTPGDEFILAYTGLNS